MGFIAEKTWTGTEQAAEEFGHGEFFVSTRGQEIENRCSECDLDVFCNRTGDAHCCCYDVEADSEEII